ncbi:hypothetical protein GF357_02195 [Candidatus Dojkabacteria bacterium]|nr:hypothetical protein [Candidatus Dojkabacteria bacterium]
MKQKTAQIEKLSRSIPAFRNRKLISLASTPALLLFTVKDLLYWWYLQMPYYYLISLNRLLLVADDKLSLSALLKTFFLPWKRDYSALGHIMGIIIRIIYLPIGTMIFLSILTVYLLFITAWLALPPITIFFIATTPFLKIFKFEQ